MRAAILATCWLGLGIGSVGQSTFRATRHEVLVPLAVRDGNRPVAGLTAADFELLDNGTPRTVTMVATDSVPIEVSVLIDVSGSTADLVTEWRGGVTKMQSWLRASDTLRVLTFSDHVREWNWPAPIVTGGATALYDALLTALVQPPDPLRRTLVIAFTDGYDTASAADVNLLMAVARRSYSVLFVVLRESGAGVPNEPKRGVWMPFRPSVPSDLQPIAEITGGWSARRRGVHSLSADDFREIFEEFRASYVLSFTPDAASLVGWHELTVRLKRPCRCDVRARKGYEKD